MSAHVTEIQTDAEFREAVKSGTVLVDFFATWCHPCRAQMPILEELAVELGAAVRIVKVDTDKFRSITEEFHVTGIPTLFLIRDGEIVKRFSGPQQAEVLKQAISG